MSVTKQAKPQAIQPTIPTAIDPVAQLRDSRDRLAQLQREEAEIAGHIRSAILAEDGGRVSALTARQTMLPTLIGRAAEALLPLELTALKAEAGAIAAAEDAHRAVTAQAEAACVTARDAFFEAERRYNVTKVAFQVYAIRRQEMTRQRHALRDRLARLIAADAPLPAA
jgi:hypothetical protein